MKKVLIGFVLLILSGIASADDFQWCMQQAQQQYKQEWDNACQTHLIWRGGFSSDRNDYRNYECVLSPAIIDTLDRRYGEAKEDCRRDYKR